MIIEIEDILGQKKALGHVPLPPGLTLGQIFDDEKLRRTQPAIVEVDYNGARIDNWRELNPAQGDRVLIKIAPSGPLIPAIILAVQVLTAVFSVVRFFMSLFARPPHPKQRLPGGSGTKESPTHSFEGIRTATGAGNPVPVPYGMHKTGGQLLAFAIDVSSAGKRQELSMLIGVGEGPVSEIGSVEINGIAISEFQQVTTETRLGTQNQAVIKGFERIRNTFSDNRQFTDGQIVYTSNGNQIEAAEVQVAALGGLAHITATGDKQQNMSRYSVAYKLTTGSVYTVATTRDFTAKTLSEVWDKYLIDFGSRSQWDIRLNWLTATNTDDTKDQWRLWLKNVTEIQERTENFSSTALLAIKAVATAQLQGGQPNVTCMVGGRTVRQLDSQFAVASVGMSNNPAWNVMDYMTNSIYGMGPYYTESDLDLQSFFDFATICVSQVPDGRGGLEDQHHLDIILDFKKPHLQHVHDILANYRSAVIWSDGNWKIVTDRADTPTRQVFHSGNMLPKRTQVRLGVDPLKPNQCNVDFMNARLGYTRDPIPVVDNQSVLVDNDPIKDFDLSLLGITRESEAIREANYHLRRRRDPRREVTWATGLEALAVEPGDLAWVGVVTTNYEAGYGGRVLDGSSSHVVLDREIDVLSGKTYDLLLWHTEADTLETRTLGSATGITITVSPTAIFAYQAKAGDRWAIGVASEDLMRVRIIEVGRTEDGFHQLRGEEFVNVAVTTPSLVSTGTSFPLNAPPPQPQSAVVREQAVVQADGNVISQLFFDITPPPALEAGQLTAPGTRFSVTMPVSSNPNNDSLNGELVIFNTGSGRGITQFIAAYNGTTRVASVTPGFASNQVPTSGNFFTLEHKKGHTDGFEVWFRTGTNSDFSLQRTFNGVAGVLDMIPQRQTIGVKIIPYSNRGARNETGPWVRTVVTTGDTTVPDNIADYAVRQIGSLILHTWDPVDDSDLDHYEIREGSVWETGAIVEDTVYRTFFEMTEFVPGNHNYMVKAVDRSGNASATAAEYEVTLFEAEARRQYLVRDELDILSGSLSGMAVVQVGSVTNLLLHSESFGVAQAIWTTTNATIPSSVFRDPFRQGRAGQIDCSAVGTSTLTQSTATNARSQDAVFSVWVKAPNGKGNLFLRLQDTITPQSYFQEKGVTAGNEWKHATVAYGFPNSATGKIQCQVTDGGENGLFHLWGAQCELATAFTHYVKTGSQTAVGDRPALGLLSAHLWDQGGDTWDDGVLTWDLPHALTGTYQLDDISLGALAALRIIPEVRFFDADGTFDLLESHSIDGRNFTGFNIIGAGDVAAQKYRLRASMTATNSNDNPRIDMFRLYLDGETRNVVETVAVASGGTTVTVRPQFLEIPDVQATAINSALAVVIRSLTVNQFQIALFNPSSATVHLPGDATYAARGL